VRRQPHPYDRAQFNRDGPGVMQSTLRAFVMFLAASLLSGCLERDEREQAGGEPPAAPAPSPPTNAAPTLSVAPSFEVLVGRALTVTPSASDPDGDTLSYSIADRPDWMSFSAQTGRLSGTPGSGDVGVHRFVITVSDGVARASREIQVTVAQAAAGRATVSWLAPDTNVDGSPLTDLAGFRVYYGSAPGDLRYVIQVADPGARNRVIENLTIGTWYFAATAYDQSGSESARSNVASKAIA
jgi:hypothetical protein